MKETSRLDRFLGDPLGTHVRAAFADRLSKAPFEFDRPPGPAGTSPNTRSSPGAGLAPFAATHVTFLGGAPNRQGPATP